MPKKAVTPSHSASKISVPGENFARTTRDLVSTTPETEARLLGVSQKILELSPWEGLYESQFLVVVNSRTGEKGFVSTIGNSGEQSGVLVYRGDNAFLQLGAIMDEIEEFDADPMAILQVPQVQVMFDGPRFLETFDKALLKRHGISTKGGAPLPHFRSIVPGFLPWRISESEGQFLAEALEQWFEVVSRADFSPEFLVEKPARKGSKAALQLRGRVPKKSASSEISWSDAWVDVSSEPLHIPMPRIEAPLKTFAQLPQGHFDLEIEITPLPEPVGGKDERPYFPELVVLGAGGLVLSQEMTKRGGAAQTLPEILSIAAQLLSQLTEKPQRIVFSNETLEPILSIVQHHSKVPCEWAEELPTLDPFVDGLEEQFARPEDELFAEMLELLNAQPGFSDLLKNAPDAQNLLKNLPNVTDKNKKPPRAH